ncbi:MAG: glycogen synthase GlgA [Candidatus Saganbacteria bacterium]|nr:glycogen synthase GlgA [Candidatus Saganbacteria bacterium]
MKILFAASEVVPFAKTGGLADVAGALPKAIKKLGHDIRIVLPLYGGKIDRAKWGLKQIIANLEIELGENAELVNIFECLLPGSDIRVYFVDSRFFSDRKELYMLGGKDNPQNFEAFLVFSKAVVNFLNELKWRPDIIHCNDWQSGLVPLFVKLQRRKDPAYKRTATVYSVHNMAYQGLFPAEKFGLLGLPETYLGEDALGCWEKISFAKGGFLYADVISTVSETYAKEIQTKEYGAGMDDLLRQRSKDLYGIINGVDYEVWNPATDKNLVRRYTRNTLSLRPENKAALQEDMELPLDPDTPLFGIVSRLDAQKGFDILDEAAEDIMGLDLQMCLLGTGDPHYHDLFRRLRKEHPKKMGVKLGFDAALAEMIYAGSDCFLMPSRYEPCGLGQLIGFKYGCVPVVRLTGGLADTVKEYNPRTGKGDGFVFEDYSAKELFKAIELAVKAYQDQAKWKKLQQRIMAYDFSWDASAKKYITLYMKAIDKVI